MEQEKKNSGVVILLLILVIILTVLCVLFATGTIGFKKNGVNNNTVNDNANVIDNNTNSEVADNNTNNKVVDNNENKANDNSKPSEPTIIEKVIEPKYLYDVKDLKVKAKDGYTVFKDISNDYNYVANVHTGPEALYYASLSLDGKVSVSRQGNSVVLNVTNVIEMMLFDVPSMEADQLLYFLTDKGDVYYYRFGDLDNGKNNATKVDSVSNVKKIFVSRYSKPNAGGSWALFAITGNNDCIMIDANSV